MSEACVQADPKDFAVLALIHVPKLEAIMSGPEDEWLTLHSSEDKLRTSQFILQDRSGGVGARAAFIGRPLNASADTKRSLRR